MEPPRVWNVVGLIFRGLRAWNSNEAASLKLPQILSLESGNAFILHGPNFTTYSTITANSNEFGRLHSGRENVGVFWPENQRNRVEATHHPLHVPLAV